MSADVLVVRHLNGTRYTRPFAVGSLRIIEGVRAVPGLAQVPVPLRDLARSRSWNSASAMMKPACTRVNR